MLIDKEIKINIKSSVIISKLNSIGIFCKMNDIIYLPIDKLWKSSNMKIGVKCNTRTRNRKNTSFRASKRRK